MVVLALEVRVAGDRTVVLAVRLEEPNVDLGLADVEARADEPDLAPLPLPATSTVFFLANGERSLRASVEVAIAVAVVDIWGHIEVAFAVAIADRVELGLRLLHGCCYMFRLSGRQPS